MLFIILAPLRDLLKNPVTGYSKYDHRIIKNFIHLSILRMASIYEKY
jgi:hypothetical protein